MAGWLLYNSHRANKLSHVGFCGWPKEGLEVENLYLKKLRPVTICWSGDGRIYIQSVVVWINSFHVYACSLESSLPISKGIVGELLVNTFGCDLHFF